MERVVILIGWWRPSLICMHIVLICGLKCVIALFETAVVCWTLWMALSLIVEYLAIVLVLLASEGDDIVRTSIALPISVISFGHMKVGIIRIIKTFPFL